jgi:hypothetical protein
MGEREGRALWDRHLVQAIIEGLKRKQNKRKKIQQNDAKLLRHEPAADTLNS